VILVPEIQNEQEAPAEPIVEEENIPVGAEEASEPEDTIAEDAPREDGSTMPKPNDGDANSAV
jgi:hypothetical protein